MQLRRDKHADIFVAHKQHARTPAWRVSELSAATV